MKNDILVVDTFGIRLDKFLADNMDELSRTQLQKYIKNGDITVNGEIKSVNYRLNIDDKIQIEIQNDIPDNNFVEPQEIPIDIIFEDDDIIIINKQAGLTVHPGTGNKNGTLANAISFHCEQLSYLFHKVCKPFFLTSNPQEGLSLYLYLKISEHYRIIRANLIF